MRRSPKCNGLRRHLTGPARPLLALATILPLLAAAGPPRHATPAIQQAEAQQVAPPEMAGRHRQWLEEDVIYIIAPVEREAFLMLESDEQREAFIEAFWRTRDPTPGTVRNEVREEHVRRLQYANRYLGAETPRRGWQTDRGRIYIQLGEPADTQSYADPRAFYPIELWMYRVDPRATGLPPFFYVMFYRPLQGGEYRMYDPITDGPGALAKEIMLQMDDPRMIVDRLLRTVGHEVALASVNLIPTEGTSFINPRPSSRNTMLFGAIEEAPLKGVDISYASGFVANRGDVDASVVFDPMPVQLSALAFWDERGLTYLHYGVEVPQEKVLIGEYESDYYLSLGLDLEIHDQRDAPVLVGGDAIEEHFDEARAQQVATAPLAYYDRVELVPGVYDVSITLKNRITGDTAVSGARLSVPNTADDSIALSDLLIAAAASPFAAPPDEEPRAFRFGGEQFVPAAGGRLPSGGTAELFMQLVATPDLGASETVELEAVLLDDEGTEVASATAAAAPVAAAPAPTPLRLSLPLVGAGPGAYSLYVTALLSSGQRLIREGRVELVNRPAFRLPEVLVASEVRLEGSEEYQLRGWQHLRKGELRAAEAYLGGALDRDPQNIGLRRSLAGIEMNLGEPADAVAVIRPLAQRPGAAGIDLLIFSQALRRSGAAAEAAAAARTLLQTGRPSAPAYNALAEALADLGNTDEAIAAYEASLAINPGQPEVREALARLKDLRGRPPADK